MQKKFNQINGVNMFVYFVNNEIDYVFVDAMPNVILCVDEQKH